MKLFEPITIRGMTIKNRILMSTMGVGYGYSNRRVIDFYLERARGGVGAISIGAGIPDLFMNDAAWGKEGGVATFLKKMQGLTRAVNDAGAKIGIQFIHGNRYPLGLDLTSGELVAPSDRIEADPSSHAFIKPGERLRELTVAEIESIIDKIARAAAGAREAGFNFVELHNGHGMLHCQFFSPTTNRRSDRYGGDRLRRMTFGIETVAAMRRAVGDDFPLFVRHGAIDMVQGGATLEDGVTFAVALEKAGADVFNVSLATPPVCGGYVPTGEDPVATHAHLAEAVKRAVSVPVIAVGRIKTPEVAEAILAGGKADLVAVGRQLFADPDWPRKIQEGRSADIVPCIDCHECYERSTAGNGMECTVNYRAGRETERTIVPAPRKRRVLVVGGGPAGLEAARIAALRGHEVTLQEKSRQLGGALLLQSVVPSKGEVEKLAQHLSAQAQAAGVTIVTGAATERVGTVRPDTVIVAAGAVPVRPEIPGIHGANVISSGDIRKLMSGGGGALRSGWRRMLTGLAAPLLNRPLSLEQRRKFAALGTPIIFGTRVAIMGGDMTACQLAELLTEYGRKVALVSRDPEFAADMVSTLRYRLMKKLKERAVVMISGAREYREVTVRGLVYLSAAGALETVPADTVIPMLGFEPDDTLLNRFRGQGVEVVAAGDCAEPLKLLHAVHDGSRVGRAVGAGKDEGGGAAGPAAG